jgi:hypothetical protein
MGKMVVDIPDNDEIEMKIFCRFAENSRKNGYPVLRINETSGVLRFFAQ